MSVSSAIPHPPLIGIRIILSLLGACAGSAAAPVAFNAPVELTESVIVYEPAQVDADGDGILDLTGYDSRLNRLVSSIRKAPADSLYPKGRLIHDGPLSDVRSPLFQHDIDGDGNVDVTLQNGDHMVWWRHLPGSPLAWQGAWTNLPAEREVSAVADLDRDGKPDVLLPREVLWSPRGDVVVYPALIGYGAGEENIVWTEISIPDPSGYIADTPFDVDGDGDLDWRFDALHVAVLQGRSLDRVVSLPLFPDLVAHYKFADMDGVPGAELIITDDHDPDDSPPERVRIFRLDGEEWKAIATLRVASWLEQIPDQLFRGIAIAKPDPEKPFRVCILLDQMLLTFALQDGSLEVDGGVSFPEPLQPMADFRPLLVPDGSHESLFVRVHPVVEPTSMGLVLGGVPQWMRMNLTSAGEGKLVYATWNHDPKSFAVVTVDGDRKIASLGGLDKALHLWTPAEGAASRRTLTIGKYRGIGLLAGHFRGIGAQQEVMFLTSTEDSARKFTTSRKTSYLTAGGPYLDNGVGINWRREQTIQGYMPAVLLGKGDFDADGKEDILYTDSADGMMVWRSGIESGDYQGPLGIVRHEVGYMPLISSSGGLSGASLHHVSVRDMDGDGDADIVQFPSVFGNAAAVFVNDGSGGFTLRRLVDDGPAIPPAAQEAPAGLVSGNFDGVGLPDVAVVTNTNAGPEGNYAPVFRVRIIRGGESSISQVTTFPGRVNRLVAADFNGDGLDDLAFDGPDVTDPLGNQIPQGGCRMLARKDELSFHPPAIISAALPNTSALAAVDVNGDGRADLIHGSSDTGAVHYFESTVVEILPTFAAWAASHGLPGNDVDSDGDSASDFQEYLTGTNPEVPERTQGSGGGPGEMPFIHFTRDASYPASILFDLRAVHALPTHLPQGAARVVLEESPDLRTWTPVSFQPKTTLAAGVPGWQVLSWELDNEFVPENRSAKFYRFRSWIE